MGQDTQLKWFAARIIREKSFVLKYIELEGFRVSRINDIPTLLFINCTDQGIWNLSSYLYDRVLFYKDARKQRVQSIPDNIMNTFLILEPIHDQPVVYLPVDDPAFFSGPRKRVVSGVFAGCEGVLKRIKGERRLIVKLSDRAAIATPYIPRELLEDI